MSASPDSRPTTPTPTPTPTPTSTSTSTLSTLSAHYVGGGVCYFEKRAELRAAAATVAYKHWRYCGRVDAAGVDAAAHDAAAGSVDIELPAAVLCERAVRDEHAPRSTFIALHGWLDSAGSFDTVAPPLVAATRVSVAALDFVGHGRSSHRAAGPLPCYVEYVPLVLEWLDALGDEAASFGVLAHSMGAGVTTLVAGTVPGRVHTLVYYDGLTPVSGLAAADMPAALLAAYVQRQKSALSSKGPSVYASIEQAAQQRTSSDVGKSLDVAGARRLVARSLDRVDDGYVFTHDRRLYERAYWRLELDQIEAFVRRIAAPALLLWARDGYPFPRAQMDRFERAFANLRIERVDGGHHVHLTHAERVLPATIEHVRKCALQ